MKGRDSGVGLVDGKRFVMSALGVWKREFPQGKVMVWDEGGEKSAF